MAASDLALDIAIKHWRQLSRAELNAIGLGITYGCDRTFLYRADLYERVARQLEIRRDVGKETCLSCLTALASSNHICHPVDTGILGLSKEEIIHSAEANQ